MEKKKIKVLWLSASSGLLDEGCIAYNGGGWIASLQRVVMGCDVVELAMAFPSATRGTCMAVDGCKYYPIYDKPKTVWEKLQHYYGGYKHINEDAYVEALKRVIADYKPDVIHLFGMECPFATILGRTDVPLVVHLQGLLLPCSNAFWPIGMNHNTLTWPFTIREHILRNGYRFAKQSMEVRAENERKLFRRMQFCMGRTEWDCEVSQLMSPNSAYFHVDEVLRPVFYDHKGKWAQPQSAKFIITSTISQTIYKGLDLVLKTAALLESETNVDFEWRVIGVNGKSSYVRFFEKYTQIHSPHVRYMGVMNAEELCQNLMETNVYVHPSYIDNSPNSVCEAQMLGVPVVATNVGGVASLMENGRSGILVPANGPFELAYHLKRLAQNLSEAEALGREGCKLAIERHNKEKILSDLLHTYEQVISLTKA